MCGLPLDSEMLHLGFPVNYMQVASLLYKTELLDLRKITHDPWDKAGPAPIMVNALHGMTWDDIL